MIRSVYYSSNHTLQYDLTPEKMCEAIKDKEGLLWVSLETATIEDIELILDKTFHFHHLAIEDCISNGYQNPKVDDFDDYIFLVMHALIPDRGLEQFETQEINFFLGANYLVTSFLEPRMTPIENTWNRIKKDDRLITRGSDFLCHGILDDLVDDYLPLLDEIDEEIELMEDQVLVNPRPSVLSRILGMKHSLMVLRRIMSPQREVMNRLSRDDYPQIDRQARIYFRDIYDHLVRFQDLTESLRDIVGDALSTYLSATSNRLNEIMKALTVVSTIFLPLSFFAGVYGMNFHFMPEITWKYGYLFAWCIFILIAGTMLIFFKRRGWF